MERWVGRVACVTGASSGIGEAVAKQLVKHGMKVIGCSRNIEKIQKLGEDLKDEKGSLTAIKCDVTKEEEVVSMFESIRKQHGRVDVCVNNAGMSHDAPLLSGTAEQWKHMLDVNVLGLSICTREAVKVMKEKSIDDGHVILLGSMGGHKVFKNPPGHFYTATKFAVRALAEGVRNELRATDSHIRVTHISPALVETEFAYRMFSHDPEVARKKYAQYRTLDPGDIADAIVYALGAPPHVQVHDVLINPTEGP